MKFEGARPDIVAAPVAEGFDVCCHLGLESQHQDVKRRQGKTADAACKLYDDALACAVTTIGIGAGAETDGQVLVVNDLAGITTRGFKHNRRYGAVAAALREAVAGYAKDGAFPGEEQGFSMAAEELARFRAMRPLAGRGANPGRKPRAALPANRRVHEKLALRPRTLIGA